MIKLKYYDKEKIIKELPEKFPIFVQYINTTLQTKLGSCFYLEYTLNESDFFEIKNDTYKNFSEQCRLSKVTVYIYDSEEETHYSKSKNGNFGLNITKEMVIERIKKQIHENLMKSKLKDEEKSKQFLENNNSENMSEDVSNLDKLITNIIENFKQKMINESKIQYSNILLESKILLNKENKKNNLVKSIEKHEGVKCDGCGKNPIEGNRYCCVFCDNVNYCEECEEKIGEKHGHPFYKIKIKID